LVVSSPSKRKSSFHGRMAKEGAASVMTTGHPPLKPLRPSKKTTANNGLLASSTGLNVAMQVVATF
jgi:hypothetical protein